MDDSMTCLENPFHASFDDNPNIFKHAEEPLSAISAKPFEDIQEFLSVIMIFQTSESPRFDTIFVVLL